MTHPRVRIAFFLAVICAACAQIATDSPTNDGLLVWQPPKLQFPHTLPPPTVSKEIITTLRVAAVPIILEETKLEDVKTRLGGSIGQRGDASEFLEWLCFYGTDANGRWGLWLESSEMGGGWVDGFALERLGRNARTDRRCRMIREGEGGIELPIALRLDLTEMQVRKILGKPTVRYRSTLIFDHEHQETIRNEPATVSNTVAVALRDGVVWAIQVWKDSTS
jgi:hypothetical protein